MTNASIFIKHRENPDGTLDAVCMSCFKTVAYSQMKHDLEDVERSHACNGLLGDVVRLAADAAI